MIPLAFLMNKCGPDVHQLPFGAGDLFGACVFCAVLALVWFLAAVAVRKKGQPIQLSPGFWYLAAPGALGVVLVLGGLLLTAVAGCFH